MRLLLIGGSNTGLRRGWARQLESLMPEVEIDNQYLGAVGSLFGLLRLLKMKRDGRTKPDLVIFEYALNDTFLMVGNEIDAPFLQCILENVVTFCAIEGIGLVFLCLSLPPAAGGRQTIGSIYIDELYKAAAARRGVNCIFQIEILGRVNRADYVDPSHLAEEPSRKIAQAVRDQVRAGVSLPNGRTRRLSFEYLDAGQATISGPARREDIITPVFAGEFIKLERGARADWSFSGRLVGIVIRSTVESGYYRITVEDKSLRKNAQSAGREIVPNLVTMQHLQIRRWARSGASVELPNNELLLMELEGGLSFTERPPLVPFSDQTLEVAGILIWRKQSPLRRVLESFLG